MLEFFEIKTQIMVTTKNASASSNHLVFKTNFRWKEDEELHKHIKKGNLEKAAFDRSILIEIG